MITTKGIVLPEIVGTDFHNHFIKNLPDNEYHKDWSAVSSSAVRQIYGRQTSPQHYLSFLKEKQNQKESNEKKEGLRFGKAAHMALHEYHIFKEVVKILPDFGDLRSAKNREKKSEWFTANVDEKTIVVTQEEYDQLQRGIDSMLDHPFAREILSIEGDFELTGYFRHKTGLKSKLRADFFGKSGSTNILVDFKTSRDNSHKGFQRDIVNYRYDIQMSHYEHGILEITQLPVDIVIFIVLENNGPRTCAVYEFDVESRRYGQKCFEKGMETLSECLKSNLWPARQNKIEAIYLPEYLLKEEI